MLPRDRICRLFTGPPGGQARTSTQLQHDRYRHDETATLEHSINALAGLYVLNLYYHSGAVVAVEFTPESRSFRPMHS